MKTKSIFIISCIVSIVIGTLLHFTYEWSGNNFIVGLFTPVNESVWEHLKLTLLPATLFGIFFSYYIRKNNTDKNTSKIKTSNDKINYTNFWYYLSGNIIIAMHIVVARILSILCYN